MITSKIFHRKTRRGNIVKVIREHYLRDDVLCGYPPCKICAEICRRLTDECLPDEKSPSNEGLSVEHLKKTSPSANAPSKAHFLLVDANIVLHQIDILEEDCLFNVIVPQIVLDEVKHRSPPAYKKLRDLLTNRQKTFYFFCNEFHKETYVEKLKKETANDRNDRAIRRVAHWYTQHLSNNSEKIGCVLLTDDKENARKAREEGLTTVTMRDYVVGIENRPDLLDKLAASQENSCSDKQIVIGKGKLLFAEHLSLSDLKVGLKSGKYFQGSFQASRDNYLEGTVFVESGKMREIFIQGLLNLNRSIHDDLVVVELLHETQWSCPMSVLKLHEMENDRGDHLQVDDDELNQQSMKLEIQNDAPKVVPGGTQPKRLASATAVPSGRVVGILRRNWRPFCGVLDISPVESSTRHLFVAAERRVPRIRVETRQAAALRGQRIVVCIDNWPRDSRYPKGHLVKILGPLGDKATETSVILLEHGISHGPFSEAVLSCLPQMPWVITEEDYRNRSDLRHLDICSIDPPGCTDIDDALHCRKLANDFFEVGVHIADVSHFVPPNSAMDREAADRGTTVYLVGKRIDMLPELLSSDLCSLKSNVERFAFSVICQMTSEGEIIDTKYTKSVIKSKCSFTYAQAQMRIDDASLNDELTQSLRNLNFLAKKLKEKRKSNGALSLASLEIRFNIDSETHDPIDVEAKQILETNSLVEEFMLLANIAVARKIFDEFPDCALLRRHPVPPPSNYDPLVKAAASRGFPISVDSGSALSQSLERAQMPDNPYFNVMLRILTTRCMTQAVYFCSGSIEKKLFFHFGLASPIYTHFTSPIRRYADLMVHRFLASSIHAYDTYSDLLDVKKQDAVCRNLNFRHKMAQLAGRSSVLSNTHLFFKSRREDLDAFILGVRRNALQVLVPKYGLESAVMLPNSQTGASPFHFNEHEGTLACGQVCLRTFDKIVVQISVDDADPQHFKLKLQLVQPKVENFSVEPILDFPLEQRNLQKNSIDAKSVLSDFQVTPVLKKHKK